MLLRHPVRPLRRGERPARGRRHSKARDQRAISHHYDVSNQFYEWVLGPSMAYTCAVYPNAQADLEEAQCAKHDLVARKLDLQPGMRLLDVGCGWGGMVMHAAAELRGRALGVTLSRRQAEWAQAEIARRGLGDLAEVRHLDYRDAPESSFDAISSIGLTEHIGRNQLALLRFLYSRLRPGGRLLNHCITKPDGTDPATSTSSSTATSSPTGSCTGRAPRLADARHRLRGPARGEPARALRDDARGVGGEPRRALGRGGRRGRWRRARVWRLYMAASRLAFERNSIQLHQVLGVKLADGGARTCRCAPTGSRAAGPAAPGSRRNARGPRQPPGSPGSPRYERHFRAIGPSIAAIRARLIERGRPGSPGAHQRPVRLAASARGGIGVPVSLHGRHRPITHRWPRLAAGLLACLVLAACTVGPSQRPAVAVRGEGPVVTPSEQPPPAAAGVPPLLVPSRPSRELAFAPCSPGQVARIGNPSLPDRTLSYECAVMRADTVSNGVGGIEQVSVGLVRIGLGTGAAQRAPIVVLGESDGQSSSVLAAQIAATMPLAALERVQLVGLDRRGAVVDRLDCSPDPARIAIVDFNAHRAGPADLDALLEQSRMVVQECYARLPEVLGTFSTSSTVADLERVRQLLGVARLPVVSRGDGARAVASWAERSPGSVGRLILDTPPDPDTRRGGDRAGRGGRGRGDLRRLRQGLHVAAGLPARRRPAAGGARAG